MYHTCGLDAEPPAVRGYGNWGQSPQPLGDFLQFFEKTNYFIAIGSQFADV